MARSTAGRAGKGYGRGNCTDDHKGYCKGDRKGYGKGDRKGYGKGDRKGNTRFVFWKKFRGVI